MKSKKKDQILVVDDSMLNRAILSDMLGETYDVLEAEDGMEAIESIQKHGKELSLILLDVVMPKMDGLEVLALMNRYHWIEEIPVIMISAEHSHAVVERAYELGAADFISRPFDPVIVCRRVMNTIRLYAKQRSLVSMIADQMYESERNNRLMIAILSHIVEFRNGESGLHVLHIGIMTEMLLKQLQKKTDKYDLTDKKISLISKAAAFHDIGKIAIDEHILNKPGRLTKEEYEVMKTHSRIGSSMLENLPIQEEDPLVQAACEICRWHHERYDGKGYPDGLKGEEIPITAQVVALADVYDALVSERVYKKAFTHERAVEMILNGECGAFHPLLLECLLEVADQIEMKLKVRSFGQAGQEEIFRIAEHLLSTEEIAVSNRTLKLLEEERIKYQFFDSITSEFHFEYYETPKILTISEWAATALKIPHVIFHPLESEELCTFLEKETMEEMDGRMRNTTKEKPIVEFDADVFVDGQRKKKHFICRSLWTTEGRVKFTGVIGKIVDFERC